MENNPWITHAEWVVLMIILIFCFCDTNHKISRQLERTDRLYDMYCQQNERYSQRADELYRMFIDLVKESKCPPAVRAEE